MLPHAGGGAEKYIALLADLPGTETHRFELSAAPTPAAALRSTPMRYPALARAVRSADLLHVHGDAAAVLTLPLLRRLPSLWTTHGLHLVRRRPEIARALRLAVARTRVTICTSQAEADELARIAPQLRSRMLVVHNGVALPHPADAQTRARARSELGVGSGELVALFLGELEERKAPLDALAGVRAARIAGADVVLLVAGRGPLEETIAAQGGDAIRVLGFRDDTELLFAASDVFIAPSAREGLSFALIEAMAHGLAPIVSDGPGNPEAVGQAGIVTAVGDRRAIAVAVEALATDRTRLGALQAAARERAKREFALTDMLAATAAAYELALTAPDPIAGDEPA